MNCELTGEVLILAVSCIAAAAAIVCFCEQALIIRIAKKASLNLNQAQIDGLLEM